VLSDLRALGATLAAVVLVIGSGCSRQELAHRFASPQSEAAAKQYIDYLREGNFAKIEASADPSIQSPTLPATLRRMAGLIPPGTPNSIKLVGAQSWYQSGSTTQNLTFEYGFDGKWVLLNVATKEALGHSTLVGLHVYDLGRSLEEQNRFTLSGKSPIQYAVLALVVIFPLLTLCSLITCVKTKLSGRKWPWILFILVGVGRFSVNWTTGAWTVAPLTVQLFSASAVEPLYGPWTLALSIPLGATLFLFRRRTLALKESHQATNSLPADQSQEPSR
jgi:hypothetical protein